MSRTFNPKWCDSENPPEDPGDITVYDESNELTYVARVEYDYLQRRRLFMQWDTICVSVDGACAGNGRVNVEPRAASAVYFGPESVYNWAGVLDRNVHRQTNVYADIFAVVRALRIFQENRSKGHRGWGQVDTIVVVTNSTSVSDAMTDHIFRWEMSQYTNAKGETVKNWKVLQLLHDMIVDLESQEIQVLFWWVSREYNQEADTLAHDVLY